MNSILFRYVNNTLNLIVNSASFNPQVVNGGRAYAVRELSEDISRNTKTDKYMYKILKDNNISHDSNMHFAIQCIHKITVYSSCMSISQLIVRLLTSAACF